MEISTEPNCFSSEGWHEYEARAEKARELAALRRATHWEAVEKQDADFRAIFLRATFQYSGPGVDDYGIDEGSLPWDLSDDEAEQARLEGCLRTEVAAEIKPWIAHLHSLGLVRADYAAWGEDGQLSDSGCEPQFFLAYRDADADLAPHELGQVPEKRVDLKSIPGAAVTLKFSEMPLNATRLFDTMQRGAGGVGPSGGDATPELDPVPGESRDEWLARVSVPRERLARLVERWVACGRRPDMFRAFGDATERETAGKTTDWLVEGVLARGVLTLLAGDGSAGKTSLVHEWLSSLGGAALSRPRTVLGVEVTGRAVCAVIYGEGAAGMDSHRTECHAKVWSNSAYAEFKGTRESLPDLLSGLRGFPTLDLLVIDPMRPFLKGDEKSSDAINEFYMPLERFAEDMNCAVVITQHVSKLGMNGKSVHDAKTAVLGATAVINRPRMVIAMDRRGNSNTVKIAPVKHNFAEEMLWVRSTEWSVWKHDPETHTLVPAQAIASGAAGDTLDLEPIFGAIVEQNRLGRVLRRTGRHELFELRLPQLLGVSRQAMRNGVTALIGAARVTDGPDGLLAVRGEAPEPEKA